MPPPMILRTLRAVVVAVERVQAAAVTVAQAEALQDSLVLRLEISTQTRVSTAVPQITQGTAVLTLASLASTVALGTYPFCAPRDQVDH